MLKVQASAFPFVTTVSPNCRLVPSDIHVEDATLLLKHFQCTVCALHWLVTSEDGGFHVFDGSQLNCKMTIAHMAVNRPFQSGTSVHTGFKSQHWDAIATHNINRQIQRGTSVHPMPNAQYESLACRMLFR